MDERVIGGTNDGKVITLPNRDEMLQRLLELNDSSHLQEHFYPLLLKYAERKCNAPGLLVVLSLVFGEYRQVVPLPPLVTATRNDVMQMLLLIDALVDDREVVRQAESFIQEMERILASIEQSES